MQGGGGIDTFQGHSQAEPHDYHHHRTSAPPLRLGQRARPRTGPESRGHLGTPGPEAGQQALPTRPRPPQGARPPTR